MSYVNKSKKKKKTEWNSHLATKVPIRNNTVKWEKCIFWPNKYHFSFFWTVTIIKNNT